MTAHSPEAIAAYPYDDGFDPEREPKWATDEKRSAFDAGVASARVSRLTADREALAKALTARQVGWGRRTIWLRHEEAHVIVDALLAPDGPLLDAEQVRKEAVRGLLPEGARFFPDEGGIVFEERVYYPADYVLSRVDIAGVRSEVVAWFEAHIGGIWPGVVDEARTEFCLTGKDEQEPTYREGNRA